MTTNHLGARVSSFRAAIGLSQRELAAMVGRSESWVSQVERGVLPVERLPVLQALAVALGKSVSDLRSDSNSEPDKSSTPAVELDSLRIALTGHPTLALLLTSPSVAESNLDSFDARLRQVWTDVEGVNLSRVGESLSQLLPDLEVALRQASDAQRPAIAQILASAYQAASASFARLDEADAAWLAADRSITVAETGRTPHGAIAGHFRMAHAFIRLRRLDQAEHATIAAIDALAPEIQGSDPIPEAVSLHGALQLTLAIIYARSQQRKKSRQAISNARSAATLLGQDRNDYQTEFGPTNVELHAVTIAVDLGDAGEALDLAENIEASGLSAERRARLLLDVARAHSQRRDLGDAINAIEEAEGIAPEFVRTHDLVRNLTRDLLALAGNRAPATLSALAQRTGVL